MIGDDDPVQPDRLRRLGVAGNGLLGSFEKERVDGVSGMQVLVACEPRVVGPGGKTRLNRYLDVPSNRSEPSGLDHVDFHREAHGGAETRDEARIHTLTVSQRAERHVEQPPAALVAEPCHRRTVPSLAGVVELLQYPLVAPIGVAFARERVTTGMHDFVEGSG